MSYSQHSVSVLSFPTELLQEIANLSCSLPALRLVCKTFYDIVTPHMYSEITIRLKDSKMKEFLEVLESLFANTHPGITHARSLKIDSLSPYRENFRYYRDIEEKQKKELKHKLEVMDPYLAHSTSIKNWLSLGLSRFNEVTSVTWTVNDYYSHDWSGDAVVSGISKITTLVDFDLHAKLDNGENIQLSALPPLQKLSVISEYTSMSDNRSLQGISQLIEKSSGRLQQLRIKTENFHFSKDGYIPLMSYLLRGVHTLPLLKSLSVEGFKIIAGREDVQKLSSLESLCIHEVESAYFGVLQDIWIIMCTQKMHLKEITVHEPRKTFMQYLRSYRGLHTLVITSDSDEEAMKFYQDALLTHAKSLQKLVVDPWYEGKWCFGEYSIKTLSSLINLRYLSMSIIADSTETWRLRDEFLSRRNGDEPKYEYDPSHPVCQLLQTATSLPRLEILSIRGTSLITNRGVQCGNGLRHHKIDPDIQIYTNVTSFEPVDPSEYKFTVENSGIYFRPQMVEEIGEYRYRSI